MPRVFTASASHPEACPCCGAERVLPRRAAIAAGLGLLMGGPALAQGNATRSLSVRRFFTGDSFSGVYWRDGGYDREALRRLDFVFRDLSAEETTPMDPRLFDVLHAVAQALGTGEAYEVISGYRSPETNAARAQQSGRVSEVSLHMSGMAADCRIPGRQAMGMARLAADMRLGGVGLYRRDGFVHLDCGPVRRW